MINARKAIYAALTSAMTCSVYFNNAPENAAFPYVIYDIEVVTRQDFVDSCEMEINVVDHSRNTATAETICDSVIAAFDHQIINSDGVLFEAYFERKNIVNAEDRNIVRRRLVFNFNLYNNGGTQQ